MSLSFRSAPEVVARVRGQNGRETAEAERVGRVEVARQGRLRRVPVESRPRAGRQEARQEQRPAVPLQVENGGDLSRTKGKRREKHSRSLWIFRETRVERDDAAHVAVSGEEIRRAHVGHDIEPGVREPPPERTEEGKRDRRIAEGVQPDHDDALRFATGR